MTEVVEPGGHPHTTVAYRVDPGGVAWIALNRAAAGNARNQAMRRELTDLYAEISSDPLVKVLVLTGTGDRFFCAGMDLKEVDASETPRSRRERLRSFRDIEALASLSKPTIAAINGYALGGGCEMALACDLRFMALEARIGFPEVKLGLMPGGGGTQRLHRLIGLARAFDLLYTARSLDGAEAELIGLVNRAVPRAKLTETVQNAAAEIASMPRESLSRIKRAVRDGLDRPISEAIELELSSLLDLLDARVSKHAG